MCFGCERLKVRVPGTLFEIDTITLINLLGRIGVHCIVITNQRCDEGENKNNC